MYTRYLWRTLSLSSLKPVMSIMILYFPLRAIMTGVNSTAINPALTAKGGDPKPRQSQSKGAEQSSPRLQKNTHTDENGPSK